MSFSKRLQTLRKSKGLTQVQFSEQFCIARGTIGMWETGSREPDFRTLVKIASFFGVSTDYLLGCETAQQADTEIPRGEALTDEERDVVMKFRALTTANRLKLIGYLDALTDAAPVRKSQNTQVS